MIPHPQYDLLEWRSLPWLPNYQVSEDGGLRAVNFRHSGKPRELRGSLNHGYLRYCVTLPCGTKRYFRAHRLVCEAWHGQAPSPDHHTAHGDGNKTNNHFANLRWATQAENNADKVIHGTHNYGERSPTAKLTWGAVREMRRSWRGRYGERRILAQRFGITRKTVSDIIHNHTWKEA